MDIKLIIVFAAAVVQLGLFWSYRRKALFPFILALLVSTIFTSIYRYEYVNENIFLFNQINLYPLTLWTVGLTFLYLSYTYLLSRISYIGMAIIYLVALAAMEAFGYYILGIHIAGHYNSLLGLGIIHGPLYVKVFYIVVGPIFILVAQIVRRQLQRNRRIASASKALFGS